MIAALHTIDSIDPRMGGPAYTVPALCQSLVRAGVQVELQTKTPLQAAKRNSLNSERLQLSEVNGNDFGSHVDLIHNHGIWLSINRRAATLARRKRVPLLVSPRGMLAPAALKHSAWKKRIAWRMFQQRDLKSATLLHATVEAEAKDLRSLGLKQPVVIAPNGVETNRNIAKSNAETFLVDRERTLLFLSRIHPIKGLLDLVAAWNQVRPPGWRCVVAGMGDESHEREVRQRVQELGLQQQFHFAGPLHGDEKWEMFAKADLFILPTHTENFGVVVAEALASGTPAITTHGAPWSCLAEHRCGWWIERSVESIAHTLLAATSLSDRERAEMGIRGQKLVSQRFCWNTIGKQMSEAYKWMLGGGSPPSFVITD